MSAATEPKLAVDPERKNNAPEHPKFPGIFVTRRKKNCKSGESDVTEGTKKERNSDSPTSDMDSDQCLSESISTSTAHYGGVSVKEAENGVDSSHLCGGPGSENCQGDSDEVYEDGEEDGKRSRRKRSKEKVAENPAADAVRYKTKMCKNWQLTQKCPYGPRCLFAHGTKELRSHTLNQAAISFATVSSSPERQFYALGRFPSFMPFPLCGSKPEEQEELKDLAQPVESADGTSSPQLQTAAKVTTHKPYSFSSPPKQETSPQPIQQALQPVYPASSFQSCDLNIEQQARYGNGYYENRSPSYGLNNSCGTYMPQSQYSQLDFFGQQALALNALSCAYRTMQCSLGALSMESLRR